MKLEEQVASLELSKKLKELGYKQEGLFWWYDLGQTSPILLYINYGQKPIKTLHEKFVAPTVAELGEWLPNDSRELAIDMDKGDDAFWVTAYRTDNERAERYDIHMVGGEDTEADARAKMVLWLADNGYLKFYPKGETK